MNENNVPAAAALSCACVDPMCACRGGPCAECPEGQAIAAAPVAQPPAEVQVVGEASERDWELTCDECAGTGKVEVSEALHVDGRYMGEQFLREACNTCTGYCFTICLADIPKEIQQ